jgi:protein kinase-like protein
LTTVVGARRKRLRPVVEGGRVRKLHDGEPRVIGGYRLVGVIGAGGMGRVFLAVGPDGRLAAVKQVLSGLVEDPGSRVRFVREVEASRRVSGAYTAAVMDADPGAASPWLASVYVPGPSLQEVVERSGPLPERSLRRLAVGLVVALVEIHRVGLVHRDFKPGNVLLTDDGPRVIDFGIALTAQDAERLTTTGAVIGTPAYLSPEQIEGRPATPASDIFALGAILTCAATGATPWGHGASQAVIYRILTAEPDLSGIASPELRRLIAACLDRRPERRPTAAQLLEALGPVDPDPHWLPPLVHRAVAEQAQAARALAGAIRGTPDRVAVPAFASPSLTTVTGPRHARPEPVRSNGSGEQAPADGPGRVRPPPAGAADPTRDVPPPDGAESRTRRRGRVAVAVATALAVVMVVVTVVVLQARGPEDAAATALLSPEDAARLVLELVPDRSRAPAGFVYQDAPETPEVDGEPKADPLHVDRSHSAFACVPVSDPPTPAEAGIIAATGSGFQEAGPLRKDRILDLFFFGAFYLDVPSRTEIMQEIRGRIRDCSATPPTDFVAYRFSVNTVPGADENVGYIANFPSTNFPQYPPQVGSCQMARVDAVVLRACAIVSNPSADSAGGRFAQDARLQTLTRAQLEPLVARARALQAT